MNITTRNMHLFKAASVGENIYSLKEFVGNESLFSSFPFRQTIVADFYNFYLKVYFVVKLIIYILPLNDPQ